MMAPSGRRCFREMVLLANSSQESSHFSTKKRSSSSQPETSTGLADVRGMASLRLMSASTEGRAGERPSAELEATVEVGVRENPRWMVCNVSTDARDECQSESLGVVDDKAKSIAMQWRAMEGSRH